MPRARLGLLLVVLSACGHSAGAPPALLLLTLDTTNREALGCYGGPHGLTPNLDRLAREGVLFEDARAVAPLTLPAHASLLTGLYPVRHTLRRNGETRLAAEAHTLAELAREHGHASAAFVAAVVLAPEFGLDQGFAHYDAPPTPENVEEHLIASRGADEIVARALAWLDQHEPTQPFFLWLHFYDPHFPHDPAPEYLERAHGDPYMGEVAAMDAAIGTLLARLERDGLLANTLIVAAADHGESRGRHGEETHGAFVFDSTLRIPLLARLPGAARAGERVRAPVSQVDVVPLVARVLGWELPRESANDLDGNDLDGRDPLAAQGAGVYFESYFGTKSFGWSPLAGWTDGRAKYVHSSAPEFFDLSADPGETHNVLGLRADEAARLRAHIAALLLLPRLARTPLDPGQESLQREIERLGYAGADAPPAEAELEPLDAWRSPSPHRMSAAYADYMAGRKLFEEKGSRESAIALLERALSVNPENHKAWFTLGLARQDLGRFEAAADAFRKVLALPGGERIAAQLDLGVCLYNLGRPAEALRELESALAETPGPPGALELLIRLLEEAGRGDDAVRARLRLTSHGQP